VRRRRLFHISVTDSDSEEKDVYAFLTEREARSLIRLFETNQGKTHWLQYFEVFPVRQVNGVGEILSELFIPEWIRSMRSKQ